ncbi:phospholipase D-like domain-containing protein [uncultured Shewanella sp.]|uniref:phospholipase D-like domain-containing protein n=1 Tax=uncultured Shewanella sp. TaxID=173975 RepID=UPI00260DA412|nr:phospholipase D-like domain-containing protein [uncultured Shewanella sp.]
MRHKRQWMKKLTFITPMLFSPLSFADYCLNDLLAFTNSPLTSVDLLKESGIYPTAAHSIIRTRNGADGQAETEDDRQFTSLQEIDDIKYVGPTTLNVLTGLFPHACAIANGNIEVIFSPAPYDASHLTKVVEAIHQASVSIDIAMYSFRDNRILAAISDAVQRGVLIRVISNNALKDRKSPSGTLSEKLEQALIDVRYVNKIMHHKFAIIDSGLESAQLISGSANWSYSAATRYDENTVFVKNNAEFINAFQDEFNLLWHHSRDFTCDTCTVQSIIDSRYQKNEPHSLNTRFTSSNFNTSTTRYGETFSKVSGRNTVSDTLVDYINQAESSIKIASGHLRSWPITQALLNKQAEGNVDIDIYLDIQEYISLYTHEQEQAERQACLEQATTPSQEQACYDKGSHYSYMLREQGIDVRFKSYSYRWHYSYAKQMHHKYTLIDNDTLITGSYNFSDNAEHNSMENIMIIERENNPLAIEEFINNFESIWQTGIEDQRYETLLAQINDETVQSFPIVFDPMAITWEQVTHLKERIRAVCPAINSEAFRKNPEAHYVCEKPH